MQPDLLVRAVGDLARAATGDFAVEAMLQRLCQAATLAIEVDGVGVMASDGVKARLVHAQGSGRLQALEALQEVLRQGPCQDCVATGQDVVVRDLSTDDRWPQFAAAALEAQMRSVAAVPLASRGRIWGTLDLYRQTPGGWTDEELDAARLLADVAVSYLVMAVDRDSARAAQEELARRSMTDQLTGLPNRALLFDRMEHALAVAARSGRPVAAVFVDLDRFKEINDALGHAAGDRVLVEVSRRMTATLRRSDTLARLAGDEFVLLCEDLPHDDAPEVHRLIAGVADRLRAALAQPIRVDGVDVTVTASMGVAVSTDASTAKDLLHDADTAMYAAKRYGRDGAEIRDHGFGGSRLLELPQAERTAPWLG